jgi:hypothetical protein
VCPADALQRCRGISCCVIEHPLADNSRDTAPTAGSNGPRSEHNRRPCLRFRRRARPPGRDRLGLRGHEHPAEHRLGRQLAGRLPHLAAKADRPSGHWRFLPDFERRLGADRPPMAGTSRRDHRLADNRRRCDLAQGPVHARRGEERLWVATPAVHLRRHQARLRAERRPFAVCNLVRRDELARGPKRPFTLGQWRSPAHLRPGLQSPRHLLAVGRVGQGAPHHQCRLPDKYTRGMA